MPWFGGLPAGFLVAALLLTNLAGAAEPLPVLDPDWPRLAPVYADPRNVDLTYTVAIGDDMPVTTHVMARTAAGLNLQRNREGYWVPWSGHLDRLLDNGFQSSDATLTFKIIAEDLSAEWFPISITVAYRTGSELKLGVFELRGRSAGGR